MTKGQPKTDQEKEAARAQLATAEAERARKTAERERQKQEAARETLDRRRQQFEVAKAAVERLRSEIQNIKRRQRAREDLSNHLGGFYAEVDKLAKGKSMVEATNLVVEETNQIIRDAKALIANDQYLDRVKEFVPAGENPVYPDIVVSTRSVQQALERAESRLEVLFEATEKAYDDADTVCAALALFVDRGTYASKQDVKDFLAPRDVIDSWFAIIKGNYYFDYDRLDRLDLPTEFTADTSEL